MVQVALYVEIILICFCILGLILYKTQTVMGRYQEKRALSLVLLLAIISTGMECLSYVVDGQSFYCARVFNQAFNTGFFVVSIIVAFYWFFFIRFMLNLDCVALSKKNFLFSIPMVVGVILGAMSLEAEWVFYIDDLNVYHRGPLYLPYIACCYFYVGFAFILSFRRYLMKRYYLDRDLYFSLSTFGIFPFVGVIVEIYLEKIPTTSPSIALALLLTFLTLQTRKISTDPLTGLNNRMQLHRFLVDICHRNLDGKLLYMFVIELNDYKRIVEKHGHVEGDRALIFVADVIREVCGPQGYFICRYGGDEFEVVALLNDDSEAEAVCDAISNSLREKSENLSYVLSARIGYAFKVDRTNIAEFFRQADKRLHSKKFMYLALK